MICREILPNFWNLYRTRLPVFFICAYGGISVYTECMIIHTDPNRIYDTVILQWDFKKGLKKILSFSIIFHFLIPPPFFLPYFTIPYLFLASHSFLPSSFYLFPHPLHYEFPFSLRSDVVLMVDNSPVIHETVAFTANDVRLTSYT